jgi:hypothetical protein
LKDIPGFSLSAGCVGVFAAAACLAEDVRVNGVLFGGTGIEAVVVTVGFVVGGVETVEVMVFDGAEGGGGTGVAGKGSTIFEATVVDGATEGGEATTDCLIALEVLWCCVDR